MLTFLNKIFKSKPNFIRYFFVYSLPVQYRGSGSETSQFATAILLLFKSAISLTAGSE
jgi:hypothetical protein